MPVRRPPPPAKALWSLGRWCPLYRGEIGSAPGTASRRVGRRLLSHQIPRLEQTLADWSSHLCSARSRLAGGRPEDEIGGRLSRVPSLPQTPGAVRAVVGPVVVACRIRIAKSGRVAWPAQGAVDLDLQRRTAHPAEAWRAEQFAALGSAAPPRRAHFEPAPDRGFAQGRWWAGRMWEGIVFAPARSTPTPGECWFQEPTPGGAGVSRLR
jgi:hypothetical protein